MAWLELFNLTKTFPGVRAVDDVSLDLDRGECLALMGENGAGKSTLIKILAGAIQPDSGEIRIKGDPVSFPNPVAAQQGGIGVIYQEFNLIPDLSIRDNLFLGRDLTRRGGWLRRTEETDQALEILEKVGLSGINPETTCRRLTVAQQQLVEIARAFIADAKLIVMDEPTAALTTRETTCLFDLIDELKSHNIGIIYISHRLEEIERVADRVAVLRDGALVAEDPVEKMGRATLIEHMVGRKLESEFPERGENRSADIALRVRGLTRGTKVRDVSFELQAGEILGLTGLVGAGRTELARLIFGADRPDSGSIELHGVPVSFQSPRQAIRAGICLLTEDRKQQGLILNHPVVENFGLPNLRDFSRGPFLNLAGEARSFDHYVDKIGIRTTGRRQPAGTLSGGNQQKIVLAKWLQRNAEVLIFDEPTRGIDVGAKYEIYKLIQELAAQGKAILFISSELPETLGMCDRILVMREGRLTGEISDPETATQVDIMELAVHDPKGSE
ncbi:MAG: sugar ABC transporter ATP-binding protein [Verrucomicrobiales bacterium]|nr:sugar ABC transporter ATP-binding protein [Verrucomicrobiales bacterium]